MDLAHVVHLDKSREGSYIVKRLENADMMNRDMVNGSNALGLGEQGSSYVAKRLYMQPMSHL